MNRRGFLSFLSAAPVGIPRVIALAETTSLPWIAEAALIEEPMCILPGSITYIPQATWRMLNQGVPFVK